MAQRKTPETSLSRSYLVKFPAPLYNSAKERQEDLRRRGVRRNLWEILTEPPKEPRPPFGDFRL